MVPVLITHNRPVTQALTIIMTNIITLRVHNPTKCIGPLIHGVIQHFTKRLNITLLNPVIRIKVAQHVLIHQERCCSECPMSIPISTYTTNILFQVYGAHVDVRWKIVDNIADC
jgi:hypothetical protein